MRTTDPDRILRIVGDLDRLLIGVLDPVLKANGLSREPWQVLRLLADGQGHRMGQICEAVGLSGATATRVVDALAEKMLVYRRSDPLDRRRVLVYLSDPGHEALERIEEAFRESAEPVLDGLGRHQRRNFVELLEQLVTATATLPGGT